MTFRGPVVGGFLLVLVSKANSGFPPIAVNQPSLQSAISNVWRILWVDGRFHLPTRYVTGLRIMSKAYSYTRFSSPEQAFGDSLRRQSSTALAWCERKPGIELDTELTFADHGRSAFRGAQFEEGALGRFVELVSTGVIPSGSYLLIEDVHRFSRENPMMATSRLFDLARMGITIVTTSDGLEYSLDTLAGRDVSRLLMLVLKFSQSHIESSWKSEQVGKAWARKREAARRGEHIMTARCPEWLEVKDGKFVRVKERVELVERVFQWTIEGYGRRAIAQRLNEAVPYVPPFRSDEQRKREIVGWWPSSIAKIQNNKAVIGEYQPGTGSHKSGNYKSEGEPIKDYYPRIVSDEIFWAAQAALQGRRQNGAGRKGRDGAHILRGFGRCGSCGSPMHVVNKGRPPKGGIYLCCSSALLKAGCGNARRWRIDRLEPALLAALGFVDARAFSSLDDATPAATRHVAALRSRLADAEARRKRLLLLAETGDEEATTRFGEVAQEVKDIRKDLRAAEAEANKLAADPGLVARLTDAVALSRQLAEAGEEQRYDLRVRLSEVLRGIVDCIECHEDTGAVMRLKPRLGVELNGEIPFAFRWTSPGPKQPGVVEMLIEPDASREATNRFFAGLEFEDF